MSYTAQNIRVLNNFQVDSGQINTTTTTATLPSISDTLVGRTTSDTLTNKVINDPSNTVGANILRNGVTYVLTLGGAAPSVGQVLTYTGANTLQFQTGSNSLITGTVTTNTNTPTTVVSIPLATSGSVMNVKTTVVASSGGPAATTGYSSTIQATFQNASGVVTFSGGSTDVTSTVFTDPAMATITVTYVISGTNINVTVTGLAAATVVFNAYAETRVAP